MAEVKNEGVLAKTDERALTKSRWRRKRVNIGETGFKVLITKNSKDSPNRGLRWAGDDGIERKVEIYLAEDDNGFKICGYAWVDAGNGRRIKLYDTPKIFQPPLSHDVLEKIRELVKRIDQATISDLQTLE